MDLEEIRLRALLSIRTGDDKYTADIPSHLQFSGLYPEILGMTPIMKKREEIALRKLKARLDGTVAPIYSPITFEEAEKNIGQHCIKCSVTPIDKWKTKRSVKNRARRKKPFKSGNLINTIKGVINHPFLNIPAYTFEEDGSYVECRRCQIIEHPIEVVAPGMVLPNYMVYIEYDTEPFISYIEYDAGREGGGVYSSMVKKEVPTKILRELIEENIKTYNHIRRIVPSLPTVEELAQ